MTAEPRCWWGGVSHPLQRTTGLVFKSVTTSPTLAGERMLFILQVSILSEQIPFFQTQIGQCGENGVLRKLKHIFPNTYQRIKTICSPAKGGTGCYRFNYQPGS